MVSLAVSTSGPIPYLGYVTKHSTTTPDFPQRLAELRKQHSLTQQQLANRIGMHVVQLRRYESRHVATTLDVIRKLSTARQVSADMLLFGKDQRGPDDDPRLVRSHFPIGRRGKTGDSQSTRRDGSQARSPQIVFSSGRGAGGAERK